MSTVDARPAPAATGREPPNDRLGGAINEHATFQKIALQAVSLPTLGPVGAHEEELRSGKQQVSEAPLHHDRDWCAAEARRVGTDWQGLGQMVAWVMARFRPPLQYCPSCGQTPCVNPSFCALSNVEDRSQSVRQCEPHRELFDDNVSLEAAYRRLNEPRRWPTPQATIEAIMYCARERGIDALKEPKNQERLRQCDEAARAQINRRIEKLGLA
jgi:hypothetical protein